MTRVLVEVEDFADSARNAYDYVAWPLSRAAVRLEVELFDVAGMAGDDPAGREWAHAYDTAAAGALRAFGAVVDGCFRLASLFGSSARTYAEADWLSAPGERDDIATLTARLPRDAGFSPLTAPPTAVGPGAGLPSGWWLVHDLVGYVWPNGHQDRLHRAARAWYAASSALHTAADQACILPVLFSGHGLPEADDIETVCSGTANHLRSLGHVFRTLAHACAELAAAIDWAHHEVLVDLALLGAQVAATETLAGLTAIITLGISEGVGQAAVAEECTVTAADIAGKLAQFSSRVGDLLLRIPPVRDLADDIATAMERLRAARPARPALVGVPSLPRITPALRSGGGEVGATQRLAAGADADVVGAARIDLQQAELQGGHTIAKHVGKTDAQLISRGIKKASTFVDLEHAEIATTQNLLAHANEVKAWLATGEPRLIISDRIDPTSGRIFVRRTNAFVAPNRVVTVLDKAPGGYVVRTSFPET